MARTDYKDTSASARMAMFYVTIGALLIVWTAVWFLYLQSHQPVRDTTWLFCLGFFLTGITFLGIGLAVGHIGRSARQADVAPLATPLPPPAPVGRAEQQNVAAVQQVPTPTV